MKRKLHITAMAALAAILLGVPAASVASASKTPHDPQVPSGVSTQAAVCEWPVNATNAALQTKVVTSSTPRFKSDTAWSNLECGALTVTVPPGMRGGMVVRTDAEVTCTGPAPDTTQWCLGRVLVNGVEAFPRELELDGSFAWAQSSTDFGAWESNSFTRSMTLNCPSSANEPCAWQVQVQVRNHMDDLSFRVDGSTVEAQLTYYRAPTPSNETTCIFPC
ncbi:MAG TPA: hypothetical protein VFT87_05025 [Candidatus Saccharimonadales bacterium]|nr:hypothetical protein [Candidatus Saccharimonadales bacterium]